MAGAGAAITVAVSRPAVSPLLRGVASTSTVAARVAEVAGVPRRTVGKKTAAPSCHPAP